jgi:hypothetical protein
MIDEACNRCLKLSDLPRSIMIGLNMVSSSNVSAVIIMIRR